MNSKLRYRILQKVKSYLQSEHAPTEWEMAYQIRVAIDRIRFAINHLEHFGPPTTVIRDANLQLLDALNRLVSAECNFQKQFRPRSRPEQSIIIDSEDENSAPDDASATKSRKLW